MAEKQVLVIYPDYSSVENAVEVFSLAPPLHRCTAGAAGVKFRDLRLLLPPVWSR